MTGRLGDEAVRHVGRLAVMRLALHEPERSGFVLQFDVEDIGELDVRTLARIVRAAEHRIADHPVGWHADFGQTRENRGLERGRGMIEGKFDFA